VADEERIDELLEQAKAPLLVSIAAAVLALEGFLLAAVGVQALLFLKAAGVWGAFPPAMAVIGVLSIAAAFGMGKLSRPAGPVALLFALASGAVSGVWLLFAAMNLILSPVVFLAAATSVPAFLLTLVAMFPFRKCVHARRELRDELEEVVPSSGNMGLIIAVCVVGIIVAGVIVAGNLATPGRPMWVAIALRGGVDASADMSFASTYARQLERRGLVAVIIEEPFAEDASLDPIRAAARKAEAAHAIVFDLSVTAEREGILAGTQLWAVTCTATFTDADGDMEVVSEPIEFAYERGTAGEVVYKVAETWAEAFEPWLVQQLFVSEDFAPALVGEVDLDDAVAAMELASMEDAVWDRKASAEGYPVFCELEAEGLKAQREAEINGVQCLDRPCRHYTLVGVDGDGRAIVQDGTRVPMFKIPATARGSWTETPERIFAVDPAHPDQEVDLLRASNFYDFGKVDLEGVYVSVETFDANQQEAIYTVDLVTGTAADIARLEYRERTSWLRAAPDGAGALVKIKKGPCLLVSGNRRTELPAFTRARWVMLSAGPHFIGQMDDMRVTLYDADGRAVSSPVRLDGWLSQARASDDDEILAVSKDGYECDLVTLGADLRTKSTQAMPGCLKSPQILPDGRLVGITDITLEGDAPYDTEVALWEPGAEAFTQLTTGALSEETVYVTQDGKRALFNRRLDDWPPEYDTRTYRRQVCWLDLPESP